MTLQELALTIKETLGLQVVTLPSLITCINNCYSDLHSRGYREYNEVTLSKADETPETLTSDAIPAYDITGLLPTDVPYSLIEALISGKVRTIRYLKIVDEEDNIYNVERLNMTSPAYKGWKDDEGNYRTDFSLLNGRIVFWVVDDKIFIDTYYEELMCSEIIVGVTETLKRVPMDSLQTYELDIREDLITAITLYGAYFFSQRMRLDPELQKEKLNLYKYFVEDIQADLYKEDAYSKSPSIEGGDIYE